MTSTPRLPPLSSAANSATAPPEHDRRRRLHNVFVYGSLMADEVVGVLLKRVPTTSPAVLHGHQRYGIKGRVYPAILPVDSKKVTGKVLLEITDLELDVLDTFEDVEYERNSVEISIMDSLEKLHAYTYVWGNKNDPDLKGGWDFDEWKQLHMKDFLEMTTAFMQEFKQPQSGVGRLSLQQD